MTRRPQRARGPRPVNPWQAATALGRRLSVKIATDNDSCLSAEFTHPDQPIQYRIVAWQPATGLPCGWAVLDLERAQPVVLSAGELTLEAARQFIETRDRAEPRRMAAWNMLNALAVRP